jgi:putative PIN family toxin of toxin-antitoxin system
MRVEDAPARSPPRVVIDSNVWISAALSPHGAPAQLIRRVLAGGTVVFSADTFAELEQRLWMPKFDRYLNTERRHLILHDLSAIAFWVEPPPAITGIAYSRDPDDDKFIHAALAARARWLVTGDQDLLTVPAITGLGMVSPSAALQQPRFCC